MAKVIVFGPTGNVGAIAARTAQEHGAKVFLAMRDTNKSIRGLSAEAEKAGGFERVQADLTKPDSVAEAVKKSGATHAFIYLAHGGTDHMRGTLEALKSAGITFVVFLSSYTVHGDPKQFAPSEMIPYVHAQVELQLDDVYGADHYVALRPGGFATNIMRYKNDIHKGEVPIYGSDLQFDLITPDDMGRVAGTVLAEGKPRDPNQRKVYLYGPQMYTQGKAISVVGDVLGKDVKINEVDEEAGRQMFANLGVPKPAAEYMLRITREVKQGKTSHVRNHYDEGVKNVELYTGKSSMPFEDWVKANTDLWTA